jgi:peptidoglycan/LPS O-acetylase OafA/YrhL
VTTLRESAVIGLFTATLTQAWFPLKPIATFWNTPGWSLSVEAFLYLLFPLLLFLVRRSSPLRSGAMLLLAIVVAGLLQSATRMLPSSGHLLGISGTVVYPMHPIANLPGFVIGIAMAQIFMSSRNLERVWGVAAVFVMGILLIFALRTDPSHVDHPLHFLLPPAFALIVIGLASGCGVVTLFLSTPALVRLGESSYALYLLHAPLWAIYQQIYCNVFGGTPQTPAFDLGYVTTCVICSLAAYRWVEKPSRDLIRNKFSKRYSIIAAPAPYMQPAR